MATSDFSTASLGRSALPVLGMLDCESCLAKGHKCKGTHTNDAGRPVCVFCLDGEPCPITKRKPGRPPAPPRKETTPMTTKPDSETTKVCIAPSRPKDPSSPICGTTLRPSNKSGFCHMHFHLSKKKPSQARLGVATATRAPRVTGNHHATPAKRSNASNRPNRANGIIQLNLTEAQLDDFFRRLPVAERALIVNTYLAGGR